MSQHDPGAEEAGRREGQVVERFEALIDREAIGEELTAEERAFVAAHEAAHPELAQERAIYEAAIHSLHEQLEAEEDEQLLAREAEAALERYRSERPAAAVVGVRNNNTSRRVAIGALALAAGLALWLGLRPSDSEDAQLGAKQPTPPPTQNPEQARPQPVDPRPAPAIPVDPIGRLSMVASDQPIELGLPLELGASLFDPELGAEVERACVSWSAPTAVVCFEGELASVENPEQGERRLFLESGRLVAALAPLAPGQRFTVETVVGTVSAIGTVFAVEIYEGRAWVTVLEGRVELRDPTVRVLTAGHRTSLRGEVPGDEPTPLEPDAIPTALTQLVSLAELLRASPGDARVSVPPLGEHVLQLDGFELDGPARVSIAEGDHALRLLDAREAIVLEQGITLDPRAELDLTDTLPAGSASAKPSDTSKAPSAKQLAEAAQRERAAKHYDETAKLYRELLRRYPDSPEAANVPVRLGDLLASTGDHQGALEAYERYLERGSKQLLPEAEYGRILALRALGREADERAAIEAFVTARPEDYRSAELQTRLAEIGN
jgi:hypothetical protein